MYTMVFGNEKTLNGEVVIVNDGMDKEINEKIMNIDERTNNYEVDVTESNKVATTKECKVERLEYKRTKGCDGCWIVKEEGTGLTRTIQCDGTVNKTKAGMIRTGKCKRTMDSNKVLYKEVKGQRMEQKVKIEGMVWMKKG